MNRFGDMAGAASVIQMLSDDTSSWTQFLDDMCDGVEDEQAPWKVHFLGVTLKKF